ncbi:MAG: VWA domain-containing protein [Candidatus Methylacidiphilaceae bacterium]
MTWRSPNWLILALPLLGAAAYLHWRSKAGPSKGSSFLRLVPADGRWAIRSGTTALHRRPWFFFLAGVLSVLSLAGPQWGQSSRQLLRPSTDVILALDLSRSMTASDLPPSRLDRAKLLIRTFLQEATGERIGLLVFSNSAQLAVPLTTDYGAIEELLDELTPASLPEAGTSFTALLDEACEAFSQSDASHRVLLILSDGEDHGGGWTERLPRLARIGVRIYAIGLGTERGGLIPDPRGGVLKAEGGHPVLSRLQPEALRSLAAATRGRYFRGDRWVTLPEILGFDSAANATRLEQTAGRAERFAYFLLPAVLCWCASLIWELPAFRSSSRGMSPASPPAVGSKLPLALLLGLTGFSIPLSSSLAKANPAAVRARDQEDPLVRCVRALARKDRLTASDYAALAQQTISWCRIEQERGLSAGVIQDGLAAVDRGERLDPRLFPWGQLRRELQDFLKAAHPPDASSQCSSSLSRNQSPSSTGSPRFRPSGGGLPPRPRPFPGFSDKKGQNASPSYSSDASTPRERTGPQSREAPPGGQNGAKARLQQVERLDHPALLFERMRQKETEQVDVPPEPMDW